MKKMSFTKAIKITKAHETHVSKIQLYKLTYKKAQNGIKGDSNEQRNKR